MTNPYDNGSNNNTGGPYGSGYPSGHGNGADDWYWDEQGAAANEWARTRQFYGGRPGSASAPALSDRFETLRSSTASVQPVRQPRAWPLAVLLCLFFGLFGVHNFYLGYTKRGLVQLGLHFFGWLTTFFLVGFVVLGVLGIWVLCDLVRICARSGFYSTDADGVPLLR